MRSELNSPALTLGVTALQAEQPFRHSQAVAGGLLAPEKPLLMCRVKWDCTWRQWDRGNGDNQAQLLPRPATTTGVGGRKRMKQSKNLWTNPMAQLCQSWNVIFIFCPGHSNLHHAKERGSLKDWSCGKTKVELMGPTERGLSYSRATLLQLQSFAEPRGRNLQPVSTLCTDSFSGNWKMYSSARDVALVK